MPPRSTPRAMANLPWKTGVRRLPVLSVVLVFLTCLFVGFELAIIFMVNGKPRSEAPKLPYINYVLNLYNLLSLGSTSCTTMMNWAFQEAVIINFWVTLVDEGMTLSELHYVWMGSTSCIHAVKAMYHRKAVWISCLSVLFTLTNTLHGPLMHFAATSEDVAVPFAGTTNIHIATEIMPSNLFSTAFQVGEPVSKAYREFLANKPIQFPQDICNNCTVDTPGFGWDIQCTSSDGPEYDIAPEIPTVSGINLLWVNIRDSMDTGSGYAIIVETLHKPEYGCTGKYIFSQCSLRPSIASYRLHIKGNATHYIRDKTLQEAAYNPSSDVQYYPYYENCPVQVYMPVHQRILPQVEFHDERFKPFGRVGQDLFNTYFGAVRDLHKWHMGEDDMDGGSGKRSHLALAYGEHQAAKHHQPNPCNVRFQSPTTDILEMYRELALRVLVITATNENETRRVSYYGETVQNIQKIRHMALFIVAGVVGLFGPLCILFITWRFHKLGREFTISPLELANAFLHHTRSTDGHEPSGQSLLHVLAKCNSHPSQLVKFAREWDQGRRGPRKPLRFGEIAATGVWGIDLNLEGSELVKKLEDGDVEDDGEVEKYGDVEEGRGGEEGASVEEVEDVEDDESPV